MIHLEIKDVPPLLLNSRMHWRALDARKIAWYGRVLVAVRKQRPPSPFPRAFVSYLRVSGNSNQRPDYDNLVSSFKWVQDALIYCGVLAGDTPNEVEAIYDWRPAPRKGKTILARVVVDITPIY